MDIPSRIIMIRESTWSNIGTDLHTGIVEEALSISNLNFNVTKENLFLGNGVRVNGKVAQVANYKTGEHKILGITGQNYEIIQNPEAFAFANYLNDDFAFVKGGLTHTGMIYLIGKLPEINILDDKFTPYVIFQNSFNGKYQLSAAITPLRVVCQNQFNIAFKETANTIRIRHSKNLMGNLENAKIVLKGVSNYMTELNQIAGRFSQLKFNKTEFEHVMDIIFPTKQSADVKQIKNIEEKKLEFVNAYSQDDNANFKGSAWGIINAYTDILTHRTESKQTKYNDTKFIKTTFNPMNKIIDIINIVKNTSIAA